MSLFLLLWSCQALALLAHRARSQLSVQVLDIMIVFLWPVFCVCFVVLWILFPTRFMDVEIWRRG